MFQFHEGVSALAVWGVWLAVFAALFLFNEFARRWKWAGFFSFVILPVGLSVLWFTVLKDKTYGWLMQKQDVLAFVQARAAEGGAGALIVLLAGTSRGG